MNLDHLATAVPSEGLKPVALGKPDCPKCAGRGWEWPTGDIPQPCWCWREPPVGQSVTNSRVCDNVRVALKAKVW